MTRLAVIQSSSGDLAACAEQVLQAASENLRPEFPRCLAKTQFRADFGIPWNTIGLPETLPDSSELSKIRFWLDEIDRASRKNIEDLESYKPDLEIRPRPK